jgi:siroheme synthase-like protein
MGYPIVFDLSSGPVVLVGGGRVATRRARRLLDSAGDLRVIAPDLTEELLALANTSRLFWTPRAYQPGDLDGAILAMAATDDRDVNARVATDARARKIPVTIADDPDSSDFHIPAVVVMGPLQISIDTGGTGPAISRALRAHLQQTLSTGWAHATTLSAHLRPRITSVATPTQRAEFWRLFAEGLPDRTATIDDELHLWLASIAASCGLDPAALELPSLFDDLSEDS